MNGWRKSSHSFANGNCTEVASDGEGVAVRDSQDPDGTVLVFGPVVWVAFLAGLRSA